MTHPGRAMPLALPRRLPFAAPRPVSLLKVAVFALLVLLIGLPLYRLVMGSFRTGTPFEPGDWTTRNYGDLFSDPMLPSIIGNSLIFASGSSLLAMFVGVGLAWLVVRTDLPLRRVWEYCTLTFLLIPVLIGAIAWSILLGPRTGLLNELIFDPIFGWRFNPYSMAGMIWVQTLYMVPLVFVLVAAGFRRADPEMEHASRVAGSSGLRTFFKVTLGVARPAVLSAFVIVFVIGLESIEMPLVFGFPGQVYVLAGDVYRALRVQSPARWGVAAAISVLLVGAVIVLFIGYLLGTRRSHRFVTVGGKGRVAAPIPLGRWRWPCFAAVVAFFSLTLVMPLLAVVYTSVVDFPGSPSMERLSSASFTHYLGVFDNSLILRATKNSLLLAVGASIVVLALSVLLAVLSVRFPSLLSKVNDGVSLIPISVPRLAMASAILWSYITLPFGFGRTLYGTLWIMGLAYVVKFIPIGVRQMAAQLVQIAPELEHASRVAGSGPLRTIRRVVVPLLAPALTGAFFLAFISFFHEFSSSVLLFASGTEVFSVALFDMFTNGDVGQVAALTVMFIAAVVAMLLVMNRYVKGIGSLYGD